MILERLYKSKLQNSVQLQTVLALYGQETARNNGKTNYLRLTTVVTLHIDQIMRTRNFRVRNDVVERGSVTKSQKGKKAHVERKVGECFSGRHMDNVPEETHVVSIMTQEPLENSAKGQRQKGRSSSLASHSKAKQTDGEGQKSSQGSGSKQESSLDKSETPC